MGYFLLERNNSRRNKRSRRSAQKDVHNIVSDVSILGAVYCKRADLRSCEISHYHRKVRPFKTSQLPEVHHQRGRNGPVRTVSISVCWSHLLLVRDLLQTWKNSRSWYCKRKSDLYQSQSLSWLQHHQLLRLTLYHLHPMPARQKRKTTWALKDS